MRTAGPMERLKQGIHAQKGTGGGEEENAARFLYP
jgi:hypothetical protein